MNPDDVYRIEYRAQCPADFRPEPTPTNTKDRPKKNPGVPPSKMTFVTELDENRHQDFAAQTWETLSRVNADNFLTFNEKIRFPKPELRIGK